MPALSLFLFIFSVTAALYITGLVPLRVLGTLPNWKTKVP